MRAFEEFDVRLALQRFERMERKSLLMHERLRGHQVGGFRKLISCVIGLAGAFSQKVTVRPTKKPETSPIV